MAIRGATARLATERRRIVGQVDVDTRSCYRVHMPDVGIRELKQHLSAYLDRAERGEVLQVTERGRPKAMLGPVPGRARIDEGVKAGWITPGTGAPLTAIRRARATRRVLDVLAEDREE